MEEWRSDMFSFRWWCSYRKAFELCFRCYFVSVGIARSKENPRNLFRPGLGAGPPHLPVFFFVAPRPSGRWRTIICCRAFCPRYKRTVQRSSAVLRPNAIDYRERRCKRRAGYIRTGWSWRSRTRRISWMLRKTNHRRWPCSALSCVMGAPLGRIESIRRNRLGIACRNNKASSFLRAVTKTSIVYSNNNNMKSLKKQWNIF